MSPDRGVPNRSEDADALAPGPPSAPTGAQAADPAAAPSPDSPDSPDSPGETETEDADRPDETEAERADRNFADLLQELRVTQTGVQILFAFLLTIPLQNRFTTLDGWQRHTFVAALLLCAGATVCLIAPVAYHRALYARKMKHQVVIVASRFAVAGLGLLGLAIACSVDLILDVVIGRDPALALSAVLTLILILTWGAFPLATRHRHPLLPPPRPPRPSRTPRPVGASEGRDGGGKPDRED